MSGFGGKTIGSACPATGRLPKRTHWPEWLVLLPALTPGGQLAGGEVVTVALAPLSSAPDGWARCKDDNRQGGAVAERFAAETRLIAGLDEALTDAPVSGRMTCCPVVVPR
jgi:hypothetical protein